MNIVFDFGNVLVEWNPVRLLREHYGSPHDSAESAEALASRLINHDDWVAFDTGHIEAHELAARSAERLGLDPNQLLSFIERIPHVLPVFDTSVAAMEALATQRDAHRVLYLSNMPVAFAEVLERRCPWIGAFEGGIFSGRELLVKPDPAIYAALEARYGLQPEETLFLDDSPPNVAAARARGWHAELIREPQNVQRALRQHIAFPG